MAIKKRITGKPKPKLVATVELRPGFKATDKQAYMVTMKGKPTNTGSKESCEEVAKRWEAEQ